MEIRKARCTYWEASATVNKIFIKSQLKSSSRNGIRGSIYGFCNLRKNSRISRQKQIRNGNHFLCLCKKLKFTKNWIICKKFLTSLIKHPMELDHLISISDFYGEICKNAVFAGFVRIITRKPQKSRDDSRGGGRSNKLARFRTAHDPRDSFCASLNFICDSNLWKLISFFREARINLCLINLPFLLLPASASLCRSEETQTLHKHLARLDFFFGERETFARWSRHGEQQKKVKLNYLWKYTQTLKPEKEKPRRRNRRHFLNIKMTRDCWWRRRSKSSTTRTGTLWLSSSFLISRIGAKHFAKTPQLF